MTARLIRIDWPDTGIPDLPPPLTLDELRRRLAAVRGAMAARGLAALAVYGDREHFANIQWLTGFDPRFEETLLVVRPDGALLLAGNECLPYTGISPLVQAGDIAVAHCASFSLISQPRKSARLGDLLRDAVPAGGRVGAAGWKYFEAGEVDDPATTLDLPSFLADPLRRIAGEVVNATDLFMHPGYGLRATVDASEIARLEFANHMAAAALRRMVFAFHDGMTDFAAFEAAGIGGLPLGCHATFATGGRAAQGLSGPTGERLRRGSPISFNVCHWGANICRAGWLAEGPADLPEGAQDYLEAFAFPYMAALSDWCSMMRPGVKGGEVWRRMMERLPQDRFGVELNPGHLIGMDEWLSSPVSEGSDLPLRSGMAMQCDIIPGHPVYGSTRMEDGYVIADAALQADLAASYPAVAARCASRARFMRDRIGLDVPETLLPLADSCGIIAPWLFDPSLVIALR
ncbi:aminopeptidase P family N-terminal domain-containing protein [Tabrizicola sp. J26]|uniref:M24 family metallopeptidase n=1 Tax=Alitabrizicola rongguiensis TaxID=2909234 RepID=UPI001F2360AD|nr:aminopeptidase P family N-terminal domain-containing protein [Tabrizicola rongguiensis]MCF1707630.1 aminopeptidase P family N-terminal domain-containing protein [Tabrizicola rongguiensis]